MRSLRKIFWLVISGIVLVCPLVFASGEQESTGADGELSGDVTFLVDTGHPGLRESLIDPFEAAYPDIHVEIIEVSPVERLEKLVIMLGSGTAPDLFECEETYYQRLAPEGFLYNIDDLVEGDPAFDYSMFDPNGIAAYQTYDGTTLGLPISPYHKILLFNKETFDRYGVDYPYYGMTMEDLLETARELMVKIREAGDDERGMRPFCQWEILIEPLTSAMGVGFYDPETLTHNFDDPRVQKAVEFWVTLWNEGLLMTKEEARAKGYGDTYKLFIQGQFPMIIEHSWILEMPQDETISDNPFEGVYDCIPIPSFEGEPNMQPPVSYHGLAMTTQVENPSAAYEFMKFTAENWYSNLAMESGVAAPAAFLDSDINRVLLEYFPGYEYVLTQEAAQNPPHIPEIHNEIIWSAIKDVTSEGAIQNTPFDEVIEQMQTAVQAVLDRYKREHAE